MIEPPESGKGTDCVEFETVTLSIAALDIGLVQIFDEWQGSGRPLDDQGVLDEERLELTTNFQISVIRSEPDNLFLLIKNPATVDLKRSVSSDLRVGQKIFNFQIGRRFAICFIGSKSDDGLDRIFPMP